MKQESSVLRYYKIQELISLRDFYVEIIQLILSYSSREKNGCKKNNRNNISLKL